MKEKNICDNKYGQNKKYEANYTLKIEKMQLFETIFFFQKLDQLET